MGKVHQSCNQNLITPLLYLKIIQFNPAHGLYCGLISTWEAPCKICVLLHCAHQKLQQFFHCNFCLHSVFTDTETFQYPQGKDKLKLSCMDTLCTLFQWHLVHFFSLQLCNLRVIDCTRELSLCSKNNQRDSEGITHSETQTV